jgi:hypothetical protein
MDEHTDPLNAVIAELERRKGDLPAVAKACGLSYDTVLRIKNRENDPGYSKVQKLHIYLFGGERDAQLDLAPASATAGVADV